MFLNSNPSSTEGFFYYYESYFPNHITGSSTSFLSQGVAFKYTIFFSALLYARGFLFFTQLFMNKTIIVKVGTESLANFHTSEKVEKMITDIAKLMKQKISVILISSGAVGCGKEIL